MELGEYIKTKIKEYGKSIRWTAEKMNINYKTFDGKLNRNTLSAEELLKLCSLLGISAEKLKLALYYDNTFISDYTEAYVIAEDIFEMELFEKKHIKTKKVKISVANPSKESKFFDKLYLFLPSYSNNVDENEYELKLIKNIYVEFENNDAFMDKIDSHDYDKTTRYHLKRSGLYGNVPLLTSKPRSRNLNIMK